MSLLCQICGATNSDEDDFCRLCHQKLLVVSGPVVNDEEPLFEESVEESFSFDEHLLERISILEEAVKRSAEAMRQLLSALRKQEKNLLIHQAGIATLQELLEEKGTIAREEWSALWESKMDYQLLVLEKRERFLSIKERMLALFGAEDRTHFRELLEDAEYAFFALDIERALAALDEAYGLDPDNYELAYFLGEIYFNDGAASKALDCFARVLAVKPDHFEGLVFSGVILHEIGEHARAEEALKVAVLHYPESFLPNFSLGAVYASQQNLSRAVAYLEKAVAIDPLPQAQFLLGRCLYEMGRLTPAIAVLSDAVRHDPAFEDAHHLLGLAYLDRRWHKKALDCFRAAQRLNPRKMRYHDLVRYLSGHVRAPLPVVAGEAAQWLTEGDRLAEDGELHRAAGAYKKALATDSENPTLLMSYAMVLVQLNRSAEIEAITEQVLKAAPDEMLEATAYAAWMAALRSQGKYREGNRLGRRLLEEGRSSFTRTIAFYEMAYNLAEMEEDLDQALAYARESLALAPEELRQFPLAALGWVHYKRREYPQAVDYLAQSSELAASATTLTHLGMALLAQGEEEEARAVMARAESLSARGDALEERMMSWMKDSGRLAERVRQQKKGVN